MSGHHRARSHPRCPPSAAGRPLNGASTGRPRISAFAALLERPDLAEPKEQLDAISRVEFDLQPLLNREEITVLRLLDQIVDQAGAGHRVMAQTSLGELLSPRRGSGTEGDLDRAFRSINSKRIDFALVDRSGRLVAAVEYQGSGHYHRTSFMRDAVKREALRKAGVPLIAIESDWRTEDVLPRLQRLLRAGQSPATGEGAVSSQGT